MTTYIIISIISGILFGTLDGVINANPIANKLYEVYKPIAKTSLNFMAGMIIDLAYGFILAAIFLRPDMESRSFLGVRPIVRRVLHQPSDAPPHDDHFHVRIRCTQGERDEGCVD